MQQNDPLAIPSPVVVRERLARNLWENRLLRSLLRISERAAEEAARQNAPTSRPEVDGREVGK